MKEYFCDFDYLHVFVVFLLWCLTRVSSCSYVSPGSMEKSKLRSSGVQDAEVEEDKLNLSVIMLRLRKTSSSSQL